MEYVIYTFMAYATYTFMAYVVYTFMEYVVYTFMGLCSSSIHIHGICMLINMPDSVNYLLLLTWHDTQFQIGNVKLEIILLRKTVQMNRKANNQACMRICLAYFLFLMQFKFWFSAAKCMQPTHTDNKIYGPVLFIATYWHTSIRQISLIQAFFWLLPHQWQDFFNTQVPCVIDAKKMWQVCPLLAKVAQILFAYPQACMPKKICGSRWHTFPCSYQVEMASYYFLIILSLLWPILIFTLHPTVVEDKQLALMITETNGQRWTNRGPCTELSKTTSLLNAIFLIFQLSYHVIM